jgi:hypothetical protein
LALLAQRFALAQDTSKLVAQMRQLKAAPQTPAAGGVGCQPSGGSGSCRVRLPGYPQDVAFFFTSWPPPKGARLVLYLHGHLQDFDTILKYFKFDKILADSGSKNTVLIVPNGAGPGHTDETYRSEWRDAPDAGQRFRRFVAGVGTILAGGGSSSGEPTLVLAGHSGAGSIMDHILSCRRNDVCYKHVSEVYLLDGAYSPDYFDAYAKFAKEPGHRFISVFKGTAANNETLRKMIDPALKPLPGNVTREALAKQTVGFVSSSVEHMGTVSEYLPMLLAPAPKAGN